MTELINLKGKTSAGASEGVIEGMIATRPKLKLSRKIIRGAAQSHYNEYRGGGNGCIGTQR